MFREWLKKLFTIFHEILLANALDGSNISYSLHTNILYLSKRAVLPCITMQVAVSISQSAAVISILFPL
jgi:hypothetical protein